MPTTVGVVAGAVVTTLYFAAFHGGRYPAGAVLGFKALTLARELLFPRGGSFVRERCAIETPFSGGGFRDAAEMVLRNAVDRKSVV